MNPIKPVKSPAWIDVGIVLSAVLLVAGVMYAIGLTANGFFVAWGRM